MTGETLSLIIPEVKGDVTVKIITTPHKTRTVLVLCGDLIVLRLERVGGCVTVEGP